MGLAVELLTNDLSIHGQFHDLGTFRVALRRIMNIRQMVRKYGRELHCHRNISNAQVTSSMSLPQAIQSLTRDERQSVMQWLTRRGPFWEDDRLHGEDDWLECSGDIVTDTAVGEAAYRCLNRTETSLVSLIPSSWDFSPAVVKWRKNDKEVESVEIVNYRDSDDLEAALKTVPDQIASWMELADASRARYTQLTFSLDCFKPLEGHPFALYAAQSILSRLEILDRFKTCFNAKGERTTEGHKIYQTHFAGQRAWFSDSSDTEKRDFKNDLTFLLNDGTSLFFSWHGKVNYHIPLRIHFSWPITAVAPLYIVYVGPKLTPR